MGAAPRRDGPPGVLDTADGEVRTAQGPDEGRAPDPAPGSLARRLLWFGALWLCGVSVVTVVAYAIRAVIL